MSTVERSTNGLKHKLGSVHRDRVRDLIDVMQSDQVRIGVVGLGYVGLPLAMAMAETGASVTGFDIDEARVHTLNSGTSVIGDVDDHILRQVLSDDKFRATTEAHLMGEQNVLFVCVPTPITRTKDPDLTYLRQAAKTIGSHLRPGQLIVVESTTYPGTTDEVFRSVLEAGGYRVGHDVFLAFSPERIDPGNQQFTVRETPKVVGGCTPACSELAAEIYSRMIDRDKIHLVSSPDTAEMAKLLENIFRSVNIALVNELTLLCNRMGIDVWEVIDAAATKPFGFMPFYPGPGVGGHCIPIDPYYLSWKARQFDFHTRFIELAAEVNSHMPVHVVNRVFDALNSVGKSVRGARILVLGVSFKRDVSDYRNSPMLTILEQLYQRGADVAYADPHVRELVLSAIEDDVHHDGHGRAGAVTRVDQREHRLDTLPVDSNSAALREVAVAFEDDMVNCGQDDNPSTFRLSHTELTPALLETCDCVVIGVNHSVFDFDDVGEHARLVVDTRNVMRDVKAKGAIWGL